MKKVLVLILGGFFCFVDSKTPKARINLALETVLKFDKKDVASDLKLINSLQTFLSKVKNAIKHPKVSFRRNSQNDLQLYDHLQNIIVLLIYLDDENLENAAKIALEEFQMYRYKGCKFFELMRNSKFRKIMTYDLEELVEVPADELRIKLKRLFRSLKTNSNEAQRMLIELINSLFDDKTLLEMHNFTRNLKSYQKKSTHDYEELHSILRYAIRHFIFDQYSKFKVNDRIAIEDYLNEVLQPNITRRNLSKQNSPKNIVKVKKTSNTSEVSAHQTDADLLDYLKWRKSLRRSKNRNELIRKRNTSKVLVQNNATKIKKIDKKHGNNTHDYNAVINIGTFRKDDRSDNKISRSSKQGTTQRVLQKQSNLVNKSSKNIFDFLLRNQMKQRRVNYDSILELSSELEEGLAIESFEPSITNLTSNYKNHDIKGNQNKPEEMVTSSTDVQTTNILENPNNANFKRSNLPTTTDGQNITRLESRPNKAMLKANVKKQVSDDKSKQSNTVKKAITSDPSFEMSETLIVATPSPTRTFPPPASSDISEKLQVSLSGLITQKAPTSIFIHENVTKDLNENTIETEYTVDVRRHVKHILVPTKEDMNITLEENMSISNPANQTTEENNNIKQHKNINNTQNELKIEAIKYAKKIETNKIALLEKRVESLKKALEKVYEESVRRFNHVKLHSNDSESKNKDSTPMMEKAAKIHNDTTERTTTKQRNGTETIKNDDKNEDIVIKANEDRDEDSKKNGERTTTKLDDDNEKTPNKFAVKGKADGKSEFKREGNEKDDVKTQSKLVTKKNHDEKSASKLEADDNKNGKNTSKLVNKGKYEQKTATKLKNKIIDVTTKADHKHSNDVNSTSKLDSHDSNGEKSRTKRKGNNSYIGNTPTYSNNEDEDDKKLELQGNDTDDKYTYRKRVARNNNDRKSATELGDDGSDGKETTTKVDHKQRNIPKSTTKLDSNERKQTATELDNDKTTETNPDGYDGDDENITNIKLDDNESDDEELPTKLDVNKRDDNQTIPESGGNYSDGEETTAKLDLTEELRDELLKEPVTNARPKLRTQDEIRAADPFGDIFADNFTKTTLPTIAAYFTELNTSTKSLLEGDPLEYIYNARGIPL